MAIDWDAFSSDLKARVPELAEELLGAPAFRSRIEWRWGNRGSLAVAIAGAKAGSWFDHEAGSGGGFVDLVAREHCIDRKAALDWTAGRIGYNRAANLSPRKPARAAAPPASPPSSESDRASQARHRAALIWNAAAPAPADHPYLRRKQVGPNGLRCDSAGQLIVPLRDVEGALHTIETITPKGEKRYLAGGAKAGHFCTIGRPLGGSGGFLICEGWATGASLHEATGLPVVAAMDAGNLGPVAEVLRRSHPGTAITIVADNDDKPGRDINPGVSAATKAATAIDARLAIPPVPGDANDLAILQGGDAVATMVTAAAFVPPPAPTYPEPVLTPEAARAELAQALQAFTAEVPAYWRAVEEAAAEALPTDPMDFNAPLTVVPPLLGLPVDVGLGKSSSARGAVATLLHPERSAPARWSTPCPVTTLARSR
jgi:putative DNA primase/helicase